MAVSLLLTTFAAWQAHQPSNAADDLVTALMGQNALPPDTVLLRHLPVSFDLAPCRVIAKTVELRPRVVVCCGMAAPRTHLELELNGKSPNHTLKTSLALVPLMAGTCLTQISHCAGDYVCNHLYYHLLQAIHSHSLPSQALFVHVPLLNSANYPWLVQDLALILQRLATPGVSSMSTLAA